MLKGLSAGAVNLLIGLVIGGKAPGAASLAGAGLLGFLSYGVSLTCFVLALRDRARRELAPISRPRRFSASCSRFYSFTKYRRSFSGRRFS